VKYFLVVGVVVAIAGCEYDRARNELRFDPTRLIGAAATDLIGVADRPVQGVSAPSFQASTLSRLAVLAGSQDAYQPSDLGRLVEDEFIPVLLQRGYGVVSRSDIQAILKEASFQHSGSTEQDAIRLGKILNVPAVLVITVNHVQVNHSYSGGYSNAEAQVSMGARLLSVESGEILWVASDSKAFAVQDGNEAVRREAARLAAAFPRR
jgi:curli production assembly/transport component CsgG